MPFKLKKYQKQYQRNLRIERKRKGLCCKCGRRKIAIGTTLCRVCSDHYKIESRNKTVRDKQVCMAHYGRNSGCICCDEKEISFLSIDHVKNDGAEQRNKQGLGKHLYRWLIKNNFPKGFQVLCFNCQWGKQLNGGFCPHHPEKDLRNS